MKTIENKIVYLLEEYEKNLGGESFREWCELESESDPTFFNWLFDDGELENFSNKGHEEEWEEFLNMIAQRYPLPSENITPKIIKQ